MNRDDIIRMAREAAGGVLYYDGEQWHLNEEEAVRFAKLVAAHTKQTCEAEIELQKQRAQIWRNEAYKLGGKPLPWDADEVLAKAVAAEREACARVCETLTWEDNSGYEYGIADCAAAIRARGEE